MLNQRCKWFIFKFLDYGNCNVKDNSYPCSYMHPDIHELGLYYINVDDGGYQIVQSLPPQEKFRLLDNRKM